MSTGQAPAQADLDLQQIINLLDTVLTSDDQRLKDMLRQLLVTTILITGENPADMIRVGPLNDLFNQQTSQSRRISQLEEQIRRLENTINQSYRGGGGIQPPRWGDNPNTYGPWMGGGNHPATWPTTSWGSASATSNIDTIRRLLDKDSE